MDLDHATAQPTHRTWHPGRWISLLLCLVATAMSSVAAHQAVTPSKQALTAGAIKAQITRKISWAFHFSDNPMNCVPRYPAVFAIHTVFRLETFGFECGEMLIDGEEATFNDSTWSRFREIGDPETVIAGPIDTIAHGANGETVGKPEKGRLEFSHVYFNGTRLIVEPDGVWRSKAVGQFCPPDSTVVADKTHAHMCGQVLYPLQPQIENAMVTLRHWKTKQPCGLKVTSGPLALRRMYFLQEPDWPGPEEPDPDGPPHPCDSNAAESIEFENVPSAARILLTDAPTCEKEANGEQAGFWIELRTTQKSVTFSAVNLDEFFTFAPGQIVKPGLQLVNFHRKADAIATKHLSCVQVINSATPPTR